MASPLPSPAPGGGGASIRRIEAVGGGVGVPYSASSAFNPFALFASFALKSISPPHSGHTPAPAGCPDSEYPHPAQHPGRARLRFLNHTTPQAAASTTPGHNSTRTNVASLTPHQCANQVCRALGACAANVREPDPTTASSCGDAEKQPDVPLGELTANGKPLAPATVPRAVPFFGSATGSEYQSPLNSPWPSRAVGGKTRTNAFASVTVNSNRRCTTVTHPRVTITAHTVEYFPTLNATNCDTPHSAAAPNSPATPTRRITRRALTPSPPRSPRPLRSTPSRSSRPSR